MSIELSPGADGGIRTLTASRPRDYKTLLLVHHASRVGDVLINTAKVIFEAHGFLSLGRR